jgi:hypothetical protein
VHLLKYSRRKRHRDAPASRHSTLFRIRKVCALRVKRFTVMRLRPRYLREPPMPTSVKELDRIYRRNYRRLITGIVVAYGTSLLLALALLINNPKAASWVSEAVQAELGGAAAPPAPEPTRLAEPTRPVRTVKAY